MNDLAVYRNTSVWDTSLEPTRFHGLDGLSPPSSKDRTARRARQLDGALAIIAP